MMITLFNHAIVDTVLNDALIDIENTDTAERLEFLGDCVLNLCITELLFFTFMTKNEGSLSKIRAILISKTAFGFLLNELSLKSLVPKIKSVSDKKKADTLEVIFGILFLEKNFQFVREVFFKHCAILLLSYLKNEDIVDFKSLLQSFSQRVLQQLPKYTMLSHEHHQRQHIFNVKLELAEHTSTGKGDTLVQAQQQAAKMMCSIMKLDFFSEL